MGPSLADRPTLPARLDVAVIGAGPALRAAAEALSTHATGREWAVITAEPDVGAHIPSDHLIPLSVTNAFAMATHVEILVGQESFPAQVVIVATALPERAIASERVFRGRGVSYCAQCDGSLARHKRVAAFVETPEAVHELAHLDGSAHVDVIGPADVMAAVPAAHDRRTHTGRPIAVMGQAAVEGVRLNSGAEIAVDQVFLLTPRVPAPVLVPGVSADDDDRVRVDGFGRTNLPRIFATGPATVLDRTAAAPPGDPAEAVELSAIDLVAALPAP
jgi:thioredoxin reductase